MAHLTAVADEIEEAEVAENGRTGPSRITRGLVTVIVLALVAATWFGIRLATTASGADQDAAAARDAAVEAGGRAIVTLNTLDHRTAEDGIARWQAASTGLLREELTASKKDLLAAVRKAKTTSTATLVQAALTELGPDQGHLIAVVDIKVRPVDGKPTVKRARYAADLVKVADTWLLGGLSPIAVESGEPR